MATRKKKKDKDELHEVGTFTGESEAREVIIPDPPPKEETSMLTPSELPPKKAEPAPEPAKEPAKEKPRILPKVKLAVFLATCGKKADQTAGFRRWVKGRKVRRQTIPEWHHMWETFQNRPVRGG